MESNLAERVVVITGANAGIGLATVMAFVAEGCHVVGGDLSVSALNELSASVNGVEIDLATPGGPADLANVALARFGRVDVLVNNLGIAAPQEGFLSISDEQWHHILETNLFTMIRASKAVLPSMIERKSGVIVSIASDQCRQPAIGFADYAASKTGIVIAAKAIADEFGPVGIRSISVSPGPVRTTVWTEPGGFGDALAREHGVERFEDILEHFVTTLRPTPLRRFAEPEDVAALIVFLASDLARHISGTNIGVDGGLLRGIH